MLEKIMIEIVITYYVVASWPPNSDGLHFLYHCQLTGPPLTHPEKYEMGKVSGFLLTLMVKIKNYLNYIKILSWLVRFKTCWLVHNLFVTCSKLVHDLLMTCSWLDHEMIMTYSWLVLDLFLTCLWLVHELFKTCSQLEQLH